MTMMTEYAETTGYLDSVNGRVIEIVSDSTKTVTTVILSDEDLAAIRAGEQ